MRLLIIQPWIMVGGAEWVSIRLACELMDMGVEARVVALFVEPDGLPSDYAKVDYLMPHPLIRRLISRSRLAFYLLGAPLLFYLVLRNSKGVDLLNPHNFPASWVAYLVGVLCGIPVLWTCNEPPSRISREHARSLGIAELVGWLVASSPVDRLVVSRISKIHVLSERTRLEVRSRYGRDSDIVRSCVDWAFLDQAPSDDTVRRYDIRGRFVLLTVGKLHPQKNTILTLQALLIVAQQIEDVILVVVGDGPLRRSLQNTAREMGIEDNVLFLGRILSNDLPGLYSECNVLLSPVLNQSWGLTPFEALCAGRISVVSADSGAAEVLSGENIGIVAEPTATAFARSILQVYEDPDKYDAMAKAGCEYVANHLNPRVFAAQFLNLAERALATHARRAEAGDLQSERQRQ